MDDAEFFESVEGWEEGEDVEADEWRWGEGCRGGS